NAVHMSTTEHKELPCDPPCPLCLRFCQRPNCTITCAPAVTCVPADGDCCRAKPLPTASSSSPASCAASTAPRTVLPTNEGTSIPPCSTSRTTVPVVGSSAGVASASATLGFFAGGDLPAVAGTGSLCRIPACTRFPSLLAVAEAAAGAALASRVAGSDESPSTSAVSSGSPG